MDGKRQRRTTTMALALGLLVLFSGCPKSKPKIFQPKRVTDQARAGSTQVSVHFVAPWENYVDDLQAKFPITPKQALDKVIATTQQEQRQRLEAQRLGLRLATPTSTTTETLTRTDEDGTTSRTEERVDERKPGDASAIEFGESLTGDRTAAGLGGPSPFSGNPGIDESLRHLAASALYQEVKLLSRYLEDAALRYDHQAYVVRLQLSVMPHARLQPYDVYSRISFFTGIGNEEQAYDAPFVLPLLVTDNLESLLRANAAEQLQQIQLGLSVLAHGLGGKLDYEKFSDEIKKVFGRDLNSLLTVARASDNTLRVRLGAQASPLAGYSTIPRTHNITVLLLVPRTYLDRTRTDGKAPTVGLVAKTNLVDAIEGTELRDRTQEEKRWLIYDTFRPFLDLPEEPDFDELAEIVELGSELLGHVQVNDYPSYEQVLSHPLVDPVLYSYKEQLWNALVGMMQESQNQSASFHLPPPPPDCPRLDPDHTLLIEDDGKARSTVRLAGGGGFSSKRLRATLCVDGYCLAASGIEVEGGGQQIRLSFPSLKKFKIQPRACSNGAFSKVGLELVSVRDPWSTTGRQRSCMPRDGSESHPGPEAGSRSVNLGNYRWKQGGTTYRDTTSKPCRWKYIIAKAESEEKPKTFELNLTSGSVHSSSESTGRLGVHVKILKQEKDDGSGEKEPLTGKVKLRVTGADVVTVEAVEPAGAVEQKFQTLEISTETTFTLVLRNLKAGEKVTLTAEDAKGGKLDPVQVPIFEKTKKGS